MASLFATTMKKLFLLLPLAGLLAGCTGITTTIRINPQTGEVAWSSPKNVKFDQLQASRDTNGAVSVTVSKLETVNDPDVIAAKGVADANTVNAVGNQVRGGMQDGMQMAAAYFSGGAVRPQSSNTTTNAAK